MGRRESVDIDRPLTDEALQNIISTYESMDILCKRDERILRSLRFVQSRYRGNSVAESAQNIGISRKTGYNIQSAWNCGGLEAIAPRFSDGPKPRLSEDQMGEIENHLSSHRMDASMLRKYILDVYGEEFSEKHIRNMFLDRGLAYSRDVRSGRDRWSLTAARLGVCRVFGTLMPSAWNIILSPGVTPMTFQSEPSPTAFIESSLSSTVGMGVCMPAASSLEDMVHHRIMETKRTTSLPSAHPSSPSNLTRRSISPMASPTRSNLPLRSKAADASPNVSYPFENTVSGL